MTPYGLVKSVSAIGVFYGGRDYETILQSDVDGSLEKNSDEC